MSLERVREFASTLGFTPSQDVGKTPLLWALNYRTANSIENGYSCKYGSWDRTDFLLLPCDTQVVRPVNRFGNILVTMSKPALFYCLIDDGDTFSAQMQLRKHCGGEYLVTPDTLFAPDPYALSNLRKRTIKASSFFVERPNSS